VISAWRRFWATLRELTGDDAYERYLAHWREHHAGDGAPLAREDAPLGRAAFFRAEQRRKWDGVRRCC
jgi:uncharacterized short protein YbdD (DUF466 family)